jgi:uncharacterized protein (TIGR03437 family)
MKWFLIILASAAPLAAQTQQPCTFAVTPTAITVPNLGGSGTISVNTQTGCAWAFSTGSTWIALSSPNAVSGQINGSGLLNYTASASSLPTSQQGSISINGTGISIPVTQGAAVCSMTLQPASNTIGAAGGPSSFGVQTSCSWTATSSTPWISVSSPSTTSPSGMVANVTGAGNGTVPFTAAPNGCVSPQTGTISVTSQPAQIFTLTENGSPGNLTLSPTTLSAPQAGVSGRFNVVTGVGCGWTSFSDVGWLSISTAANGTGNGGIGYTISANTGPPRAGNIHVGSQLFAVAQAGVALPTVQLNAVVSGANNAPGNAGAAVAPGEIVTLYGTNMGPSPAVPLQLANGGTSITNILGGVQVLFDGNAAPLTYVSALQINAIAPVGLAGKTSTQVTVTYQGFTSNAVTVPVQATAPGIFAADGTGGGGGAILNQDYSLNVRLNPAARGSVIMIYLTGAGVTAPASVDGAITGITPPFPSLPQSVAVGVTIGGIAVPAQNILYAGAAPEQIEGLTQIDVLIPASVTPGPTVPIVVTIGGVSSQSGLTVSVN